MGKKRVYEMAKELGLTNKELVDKLQAMGFDVRSHSSSLEDVEADAVLARLRGDKPAEEEAPQPVAQGPVGVVRRRRKVSSDGETEVVTETRIVPGGTAASEEVVRTTERAVEEVPVQEPEPIEPEEEAPQEEPMVAQEETAEAAEATPAEAGQPAAAQAQPEGTEGAEQVAQAETQPAAGAPQPSEPRPEQGAEAQATAGGNGAPAQPEGAAPPPAPPKLKEPTATQAVLVSRPLIPVKPKVPPPPKTGPGAPGRRIGPVKEYQVVTDSLGRGRELVDVTKDKTGKKKAPPAGARRAKEAYSKNELLTLARERAYIPVRGRKRRATKKGKKTEVTQAAAHKRIVKIEDTIQVGELARQMGAALIDVIRKLMQMGIRATVNQSLDVDTASLVAQEFDYEVRKTGVELEDIIATVDVDEESLVPRPPVVTVMGHVDHGKTSILDYVRKATVAAGEAGGITQHIGAYSVKVGEGTVTFIDTPGHEAFTAMRARGAQVTDLVILVVAADDSIMPQTVEAINHAKAAGVPIVVAVNKCDLPQANPERVRQGLTEHHLVPEEWGGDTIVVNVSAKTGEGIDKLLEMVLLQAEVLELRANPSLPAQGVVVEAKVERGRGPVATLLVKDGTLHRGDIVFTGTNYGKIRAMMDSSGAQVKEVAPGYPVEIQGLDGVPGAGEKFFVVNDDKAARDLAERNANRERNKDLVGQLPARKATLEDLFSSVKEGQQKELKLLVKADVQGTVEAVAQSLEKLTGPKVKVTMIHSAVGAISESDVMLATTSDAIIIGFNTKPDSKAKKIADHEGVQIRTYSVIYDAVADVKLAMEGLLEPIRKETQIGKAEVREVFRISGKGTIAGCAVTDGKIARGTFIRVLRNNAKVYEGKIDGLKRFKDDVREVSNGMECGLSLSNFNDIKQGDILEAYEVEEIRPTL